MKRNSKLLRTLSVLAVIALVCLGLALHTGTGTPSAWGIYVTRPSFRSARGGLACKTSWRRCHALAIVPLVVLLGRSFCAWASRSPCFGVSSA